MGLDPRGLKDYYADYEEQMKAHTLINRAYCIDNPKGYKGYGEQCWGLTASDGDKGYSAHCPGNDRGVITPTAALSSLCTGIFIARPCAISMKSLAISFWGDIHFFKDTAFNTGCELVCAVLYLAIDRDLYYCYDRKLSYRFNMEIVYESSGCTKRIEEIRI